MGNQPSTPRPGTPFQVIGAGISRTGTASFSEALRILLRGPVYHGGTQATLAATTEMRPLIEILSHFPPQNASERKLICDLLKQRLDGYAAVTDAPASGLVEELLEVYPSALVICTTRDPGSWLKSMETSQNAATMGFLRFILFPIPGMRHMPDFIDGLRKQWLHLYGAADPVTAETYYKHIEYLKRVVPEGQLVFVDVKDGWGPLCKALGKEVPKDIDFPRINDSEAIDRLAKRMVKQGLKRWGIVFATVGVALTSYALWK